MKNSKTEAGFADVLIVVMLLVVVIAGLGFYVLNHQNSTASSVNSTTPAVKVSHPGVVESELFASNIDSAGAPATKTAAFGPTEPKIYVVVGLKNAKSTQRIEFTRYLNGKYVDNGSVPLTKDGAKYASFGFLLKPGKSHPKGTYTVKTYTNGIFERSATYKVQ